MKFKSRWFEFDLRHSTGPYRDSVAGLCGSAGSSDFPPAGFAPSFGDDRVFYAYDTLPKGTYDFYFRSRATTAGRFIQPAAQAEMMYDGSVRGNSAGAWVEIGREEAHAETQRRREDPQT